MAPFGVVQRVSKASVTVNGQVVSSIDKGFLTLLGVAKGDSEEKLQKLITKVIALRVFPDAEGKMNLSLKDVGGQHLIVSQFTLLGDTAKGNRPSFINAEAPELAKALYEKALELSQSSGVSTCGGVFGADMKVELTNDGPVTLLLET
ncbi:MAG: D-tyrosyl-tRNA(Tyr) deacylase [Bdellovibrio sp. ArHS]|uniref:D-aminoacyl-tRNA deacylase n=1 Tax=Bdellovibrio sp. ArHS TaxID=1569284 RepID=UPI000583A896|nr:D-aminoacyl-tRNA deacylase [Bdellovibrio sp. ArHS]KHD87044.1 MAG: D-tyrosyl-tRNA(Tyr) deacylase [Bdellovibrio sp. ArHS]